MIHRKAMRPLVAALALGLFLAGSSGQEDKKRGTVPADAVALRTLFRTWGRPEPIRDVWMSSDPCALASASAGLTCGLLDQPVTTPEGATAWHYVKELKLNSGERFHYNFSIAGTLPGSAFNNGQLSRLQYIDISYSALTGGIPDEISNLVSLTRLALNNNQMNGTIPACLSALTNLQILWVTANNFTGSLPPSLSALTKLKSFSFDQNQFYGEVPAFLTDLSQLMYLDMSYNQLSMGLPAQLTSLTNLTGLYLQRNLLTGPIPPEYGNFKKLKALKLSNNQLTGGIPEELTKATTLEQIILNNNNLTGRIPPELAQLPRLKVLSLQNNLFVGSVGPAFDKFPQGFLFNPSLCTNITGSSTQFCWCSDGGQGYQTCDSDSGVPGPCVCPQAGTASTTSSPSVGGLSTTWIVLIAIGAGLLAALLAALGLWGYRTSFGRKKGGGWEYAGRLRSFPDVRAYRSQAYDPDEIDGYSVSAYDPTPNGGSGQAHSRSSSGPIDYLASSQRGGPAGTSSTAAAFARKFGRALNNQLTMRQFSSDELQLATNNFSPDNIVATDGSRKTFSGVLPSGTYIAVKELDPTPQEPPESFAAAVEVFSLVRCPELVEVLGFSCGPGGSRLLVYELMPNGSLDLHLHDLDSNSPPLDWTVRMSMALQVAKALAYLHSMNPQMVHQHLQASAVLLDDHLNAKVSDYCLDTLSPNGSNGSSNGGMGHTASSNVAVAAGTAAPELAWSSHPTPRTDVYAFGVLLLEVVCGRRPIDSQRPPSEQSLIRWVKPRLSDRTMVEGMVDPKLNGGFSSAALYQVALLASQCIQTDPESRPSMAQAVEVLQNVQNLPIDNSPR